MTKSRSEFFREHALACRQKAAASHDRMVKYLFEEMASDWSDLAGMADEIARDQVERDRFFAAPRAR